MKRSQYLNKVKQDIVPQTVRPYVRPYPQAALDTYGKRIYPISSLLSMENIWVQKNIWTLPLLNKHYHS